MGSRRLAFFKRRIYRTPKISRRWDQGLDLRSKENKSYVSELAAYFATDIPAVATIIEKDASEERSNSSASIEASDTDEEVMLDKEVIKDGTTDVTVSLSNETRECLCLNAEPAQSTNITLHPELVVEWMKWTQKGLYEGEEEDDKKREEEENKLREEIMKKFPRKGDLRVEAPKLNPEILAYMSEAAKSRDKHFVASQNVVGSVMAAVAKSISLLLELEEGDISSTLLQFLGNAGKLLAGLHYQQSVMRRAFILPGVDEKYRELLKKLDITCDLFGEDLFKRLKHTKSLGRVVEDLTPRQQAKKPLRSSNWGNRKSLPMKSKGRSQQARKGGPQRSLRFKDRQRNTQ